ncbi:hypothetical protein PR202_ga26139 [Eleusine coracana subsp. coracana]|uniref:Uncharacterized protein n=1 Tax=Eleusine coracana subsp. coracana TaxID=191504 RepID=A0AAV5DD93_ELECO|nr:hypothetical protein PR202_ga26139 [Eleusine coracana subsp. coracana]
MDEPRLPSATGATESNSHPGAAEDLTPSEPGPPFAKRPRVEAEPLGPGSSARGPEADVRALVLMAGGLYPLGRAEALRGLAVVLEKADARGDADRGLVECCYRCAAELIRDDDEDVRLAVVRLVRPCLCAEKFVAIVDVDGNGNGDQIDLIFIQLSSMARDMCMKVRVEALCALGKMQQVSESVLLQSLSKKVIKANVLSGSIIKGTKLAPKLKLPCAAGIFAHGIEDEFYQVRTAACKSMGALAKFSPQYAQKALDMLMDMMNDDTQAVRLQTLQALFRMATYGCLNVQEQHMHMFLGLLVDTNALIREAARKILGLVNLLKLQVFKSAVDGLITCLEKHPEISVASDGELILDKPRIKALLIVSISAPFSDHKPKQLDIPSVIFSHAICLVGKVSSALGEVVDQDMLLSYLCHKGGMPFLENRLVSEESGESKDCSVETVGKGSGHREIIAKVTKCQDVILVMQSTELILETVEEAWTVRRSCDISEVRAVLRTCKEELKLLSENSSGSTDFT